MKLLILLLLAAGAAAAQNPRPWPAAAVAENFEVHLVNEDRQTGTAAYASPHFQIASEIKLPLGVVGDLAAVFEATRVAVRSLPLGLDAAAEPPAYHVRFIASAESYAAAGGPPGSGGFYDGRGMLLLLPNLGIQKSTNGLTLAHQQNLFVLKHEVTHQIMRAWNPFLPVWLREGLAECVAATPYTRGRYTFSGLDASLRDYLLKWRKTKDQRSLRLIPAGQLLPLSDRQWEEQVKALAAYDHYNSAALLVHWLLHYDGRGDAAGLAEYFASMADSEPPPDAVERFLLRGRTPAQIDEQLHALCRKMAIQIDAK